MSAGFIDPTSDAAHVLVEVEGERLRQLFKWGVQNHPHGSIGTSDDRAAADRAKARCQANGPGEDNWRDILDEEVAEAYAALTDAELRAELVQVAAVCVAWIETIDRRPGGAA